MKYIINFSTLNGYTAIPSIKAESFEIALQKGIDLAKRSWDVYTFTIVGDGIAQHFTCNGSRLNLVANFA